MRWVAEPEKVYLYAMAQGSAQMKRRNKALFSAMALAIAGGTLWWAATASNGSQHDTPLTGVQVAQEAPSVDRRSSRPGSPLTQGPMNQVFLDVPPGRAIDVAKSLGAAARKGDSHAAFQLYAKLARCVDSPVNTITEQSRAAYRLAGVSDETLDKSIRQQRDDCLGAEQLVEKRGDWLRLAADQGYADAMILYAADPAAILGDGSISDADPEQIADYVERSVSLMEQLVEKGDPNAMLVLSMMYKSSDLVPHDAVRSTAYRLAAERVAPLVVPVKPSRLTMGDLSPAQQAEALALAREIELTCCKD